MRSCGVAACLFGIILVVSAQNLIDVKRLPKKITGTMCECASNVKTDDREVRRKAATAACSAELGLSIPDYDTEVEEEVKKPLPRGLAQWSRKQVENEGVDYKCINFLREMYYYQKKMEGFLDPLGKEKKDGYINCFGKKMGWLDANNQLIKTAIRKEIAGAGNLNPKLKQSLELLSLTCRGSTSDEMESYIRCASKPCADPEFFDAVLNIAKDKEVATV